MDRIRRALLAATVSLIAARTSIAQTASPIAVTSDPNDNVFTLRDGSIVRGRVLDLRAGQFVVVALPTGNRTIAWVDVVHAEGPSFPGGYNTTMFAPPTSATGGITATDYLHPEPGRVQLIVESAGRPQTVSESYSLGEYRSSGGGMYSTGQGAMYAGTGGGVVFSRPVGRPLCLTPCTLYVFPSVFTVQTSAPGLRTSVESIPVPASGLRVRMRATPVGPYYGGIGAIGGGGLLMATGGILALYGVLLNNTFSYGSSSGFPQPIGTPVIIAGTATAVVGLAALVTGIVLLATNRNGIESRELLTTPAGAQVTVGPIANGAAAAATLRF